MTDFALVVSALILGSLVLSLGWRLVRPLLVEIYTDWVLAGIDWEGPLTADDHPLHRLKIQAWQLGVPVEWAGLAWRAARIEHSSALRVPFEVLDSDWALAEIIERQAARTLERSARSGESVAPERSLVEESETP